MDSQNKITNPRDVSFSSYLSTAEENFVLKLAESVQNPSAVASSKKTSCPLTLGTNKKETGEIGVFGAERYFNLKLEDDNPKVVDNILWKPGCKKGNCGDLHPMKPTSRPGTPSVSSEASWNSQNALLTSFQRKSSQSKQKKVSGNRFLAGFSSQGTCSDKNSVYIDRSIGRGGIHGKGSRKEAIRIDQNPIMLNGGKQSQPRIQVKDEFWCPSFEKMSTGSNREEYFAFPILNSGEKKWTVRSQLEESLELFDSHVVKKGDIAMNLERKLSMLTWDAIPKSQSLPTTSKSGGMYEDNESDDSSDLFEIENLSSNGPPLFTRQASDGMSSCMIHTTKYEPSEASIQWSVVTASTTDFSVISGCDEKELAENAKTSSVTTKSSKMTNINSMMDKEVQRSRPRGLLGCKSYKAVRVAETAYRTSEKPKSGLPRLQKSGATVPVEKLQVGTKRQMSQLSKESGVLRSA